MIRSRFNLRSLLVPRSVAVVGASERPGPGRQVIENLHQLGYDGSIFAVNPNYDQVLSHPCFPSLEAVKQAHHDVDMVAILLGRDRVAPILEEAGSIGVQAAWAFAGGFAEAGEDGKTLQNKLKSICTQYDIALCGPNCVGFLNPAARVGTYSAPVSPRLSPGKVGAVVQSGSICLALANSDRGIGYSLLISSGNEAVTDSSDYLAYLLEDPNTEVILAFIEQLRHPERFLAVAKRAREVDKPIIILKVGRSEMAQRAAVTHTGALAGSDAVYDAVFRKYGVIRVDDLNEMLETAEAFVQLGDCLPAGNRVGMITVSGGEIGLVGDLSADLNLEFPEWSDAAKDAFSASLPAYAAIANPLDAWGSGRIEETYPPCIEAAATDGIDVIVVSQDAPAGMAPAQIDQYAVIAEAATEVHRSTGKPIVAISHLSGGLDETLRAQFGAGGVPLLQGTREGLRAVDHLISYGRISQAALLEVSKDRQCRASDLLDGRRGVLTEYDSKRVFTAYGIPCPQEILCQNAKEVLLGAKDIGFPVVLKVLSPEIPHKVDARLVALGIEGESELRRAYDTLLRRALSLVSKRSLAGMLVQEMVVESVAEVIVGMFRDPDFGPVIVVGLGGTMVELVEDCAIGIPPLAKDEIRELIERTKVGQLLRRERGGPSCDLEALVNVILRVGELTLDWGDHILALDINPLLVLPEGRGVIAVDGLIELDDGNNDRGS
jgi:acyl-CoA synthetase (NDP forming)